MADHSPIEWTDATWNPIVGCSITSPGCTNCYAMSMARRIEAMQPDSHYAGTTKLVNGYPVWSGKVALAPEHILTQPLRWRRPRRIFVNSMGDLFHEDMPDEWIDRVFAVMALCPQHTFQVLTKRSARMRAYMEGHKSSAPYLGRKPLERIHIEAAGHIEGDGGYMDALKEAGNVYSLYLDAPWPLANVWLGVSTEDQRRADERRDDLAALAVTGWTTFASYEPALGPIDWTGWDFLRLLISGGESGPRARPSHPDWHRAARDFCAPRGIAFFFKQRGSFEPVVDRDRDDPDWRLDYSNRFDDSGNTRWINLAGGRGFHGERFHIMRRVGKRTAGRLLDGVEHNGMPEART